MDAQRAADPTATEQPNHLGHRTMAIPIVPTRNDHDPEPIAVSGIGCRFPGDIESPDDPRQLDAEERDVIANPPTDRGRDLDALFGSDPEGLGVSYVRAGRFVRKARHGS